MSENSNTQINVFILQAALDKAPLFDSFRKLCEIEEDQKIDYVDFEWKYYQFYHGNRDLTIKRSPENSSPVTFLDLPMDVLEKVVGKSTYFDCLMLRRVSRDLCNLVDTSEVCCKEIDLVFHDLHSRIEFENVKIKFDHTSEKECSSYVFDDRRPAGYDTKYNCRTNFATMMLVVTSQIVKRPKLKIDVLRFHVFKNGVKPGFPETIRSLNIQQLNVRHLHIFAPGEYFVTILQLMKPKILKRITFYAYKMTVEQFNEVAETEQWKGAECLSWDGYPSQMRVEKLLHFKVIEINRFEFTEEYLFMVRDILLNSAHLETCSIPVKRLGWSYDDDFDSFSFASNDDDDRFDWLSDEEDVEDDVEENGEENENREELEDQQEDQNDRLDFDDVEKKRVEFEVDRIMSEDPAYNPYTHRYSVPNSQHYFQFEFVKNEHGAHILTIKKM